MDCKLARKPEGEGVMQSCTDLNCMARCNRFTNGICGFFVGVGCVAVRCCEVSMRGESEVLVDSDCAM